MSLEYFLSPQFKLGKTKLFFCHLQIHSFGPPKIIVLSPQNQFINQIIYNNFGNDGLNLDALRRSWEIPDQMTIQNVAFFDQLDIGGGGRRRNLNVEAEWHRVVDLLLQ